MEISKGTMVYTNPSMEPGEDPTGAMMANLRNRIHR
jgi:hypothetical protein